MSRMLHSSQGPTATAEWMKGRLMTCLLLVRRARQRCMRFARWLAALLTGASFIIPVLLLAGTVMGISGVYVLFGLGWALLAGCGFAFTLAALISRGGHE